MIVVCDIKISRRAFELRQELFAIGYPCACATISEIGKIGPVSLIITFSDVFEYVRRTPYDKIFVIALGNDFVNSGLNAERVKTKDELFAATYRKIREIYNIDDRCCFNFGVRCLPELFIANNFVQIHCRSVELTRTELMIFKYLYSFYGRQYRVPAKYIYKYCFPKFNTDEDKIRNNVAVNIKKINRKFQKVVPGTIIKSRREHGYYITQI